MRKWGRRAWRAVLGTAHVGLILGCGVIVAALVLFRWPELALTPPVLSRAAKFFGKAYHPTWSAFEPRLTSESWTRKRLTLAARGFCVEDSSGAFDACFDSLDADVTLRLTRRGLRLARVRRLDARGRSARLDWSRAAAASPRRRRRYRSLNSYVPKALKGARIDELDLRLNDVVVESDTDTVAGDLSIAYSTGLAVAAQLFYDTPAKGENVDLSFTADSDLFTTGHLTRLTAVGTLDGDVGDRARFVATAEQTARRRTAVRARVSARSGARRLAARFSGEITPAHYAGRLTARLEDPALRVDEVAAAPCDVTAPLSSAGAVQSVSARCELEARPRSSGSGPLPKALRAKADFAVRMRPKPLQSDRFEASVRADMAPLTDWYEIRASLQARISGRLGDLPRSLTATHDLEASVKVARFQDLVQYLQGTAYAVPAPFHVLTGPLTATLSSRGDPRSADQEVVYRAEAALTSGRQKVNARADGRLLAKDALGPDRRLEDRTDVVLEDVALELPYLKMGKIPPVSTDSRIHTGEESRPAAAPPAVSTAPARRAGALEYTVTMKTAKPVILYTNLNPQPVPVSLDLTARPGGLGGTINVDPFVATLFKRQGRVDHVTLTAKPGSRSMKLDGLVKFHESSADVDLLLLGSTDKPRVLFESEPPMDQQQIIALLLFGKPPDDLDPDQSTTVSNSQSAMATGAFGLASLYLFASTPVQYVGYDPGTQTYAMRLSLHGGASLEVGSASDQSKHLTLRKRLARHWVIETELQRDQEQQRNAVSTFLEWFQRY